MLGSVVGDYAAIRAICESHDENFKLDALKLKIFFSLPCHREIAFF